VKLVEQEQEGLESDNSDEEDEYVHAQIDDDNEQINEDEDLDNYYTELEQEVDDIMQYIFND
jgi:hypothetical protein